MACGLGGSRAVGHVHDHVLCHLEHAGLDRLHRIAEAGNRDDEHGVGEARDRDLGLTGAHRLDQDHVEGARALEHARDVSRRACERARRAAAREAPDVDALTPELLLHAHPVAEHGAAADRARRVDGEHADPLARLRVALDQPADERALAGPGRAGDADAVDGLRRRGDLDVPRWRVLDERDRARERPPPARLPELCEQKPDVRCCGHASAPPAASRSSRPGRSPRRSGAGRRA